MSFDREALWVQLHHLPLACMNSDVGRQIGDTIRVVKEVDAQENGLAWGDFLKMKIEIDLRKLISQGRTVNVKGQKIWVPLKYEKLPKICFKCRRIAHERDGCSSLGNN